VVGEHAKKKGRWGEGNWGRGGGTGGTERCRIHFGSFKQAEKKKEEEVFKKLDIAEREGG